MLPRDDIREALVILTKAAAGEVDVRFQWLRTEWEVRGLLCLNHKHSPPPPKLGDSIAHALTSLETYSLEYSF